MSNEINFSSLRQANTSTPVLDDGKNRMNRRDILAATGAAVFGASTFPLHWVAAADNKKQKVLYFSRSASYEHDAVKSRNGKPSISERILTELGKKHGFEVVSTKDDRP